MDEVSKSKLGLRALQPSPSTGLLRVGEIQLDLGMGQALVRGKSVELGRKEFELLKALVEVKGEVVKREVLLERIWGWPSLSPVGPRTVDVYMHRLRRKLGPEGRHIITVKNVGYRLDVSFDWIKFGS